MLLALDAGNSNITIGAFEGRELVSQWRLRTVPNPRRKPSLADNKAEVARRRAALDYANSAEWRSICSSLDGLSVPTERASA